MELYSTVPGSPSQFLNHGRHELHVERGLVMLVGDIPEYGRAGDPWPEVLHPLGVGRVHAVAGVSDVHGVVNLGPAHRVAKVPCK